MFGFRHSDYSTIIAVICLASIVGYPSTAISGVWIFKGWHPAHGPKFPGHPGGTRNDGRSPQPIPGRVKVTPSSGLNEPDTDLNGPMSTNVPVL